ncbi:MAG: LysR family transcriptional regulator [Lachnospiraceae bacterium]|jgi:DNA-binding transcriptional LysR family regulator|nr:LysR family transcriptional regulator [Lachnospiraceae bacterium]MDD3614798.1 LysR family transcriptional regulator [Lachnospiraceae bacterium]
MELKQLEFFLAAIKAGSLSKAAASLYTSQPNVSKVIRSLEKELGTELFQRTSRGLKLTEDGKNVYEYAVDMKKNADLIQSVAHSRKRQSFCISTYQSNILAHLLVELYKNNHELVIRHERGTVEEVIKQVETGVSEIGIIYFSKKRSTAFQNLLAQKRLEFVEMGKRQACVYVGPNSPFYNHESITYSELKNLRFVSGFRDFFTVEDGLEKISLGVVSAEEIKPSVYSNSEHLTTNLLLQTDLVVLGIALDYPEYHQYEIRNLCIEGDEASLCLGYVVEENHILSDAAREFVDSFHNILR